MKTNRYRNPWHAKLNVPKPAFYENNAPCVLEHRGVKVFRLSERSFDFVLGDCCITQRAGSTEAVREIDAILDGVIPTDENVTAHLRAHGFKALSYAEYNQAWERGEVA